MSSIGIGNIKGAKPKRKAAYDQRNKKTDPVREDNNVPLEHVTPTDVSLEQEGQLSVDVYQTEDEIVIISPIAGTAKDKLNISITDDVITIKGRRQIPTQDKVKKDDFYIEECFWGNFSRSIVLPAAVDTNSVQANFKNNVLTIRIPKTERVRTRVITIDDPK